MAFAASGAATGEEALRIFREEREHIDALVTDLMMPGMDGMELAAQIRDTEPQMSVLLVSGSMSSALKGTFDCLREHSLCSEAVYDSPPCSNPFNELLARRRSRSSAATG
jgi:CheY-like chemotaxis protein